MKTNKLIILSTLFFITIVSMVFQNCCPPKSIPPVVKDCPTNMKMENGNCVCDNMSYWDGVQCVNTGRDWSQTDLTHIYKPIYGQCNDWRDSIAIFTSAQFPGGAGVIAIYQQTKDQKYYGKASGDSEEYNLGTYDSVSAKWLEMMDQSIGQNYKIHEFGFFAKINKTRDTMWANVCNATFLPGPLVYQDTCKVIMVNVKKQQ